MRGILHLIVLSAMLPACIGCSSKTFEGPNIPHPGSEAHQQARAEVFEPFPENGPGPPIVGARPREYQDPRPAFAVLQDMRENRLAGPRPGEPILAPCPQSQVPQPPIDQPPIITPPPAIYYPPGMTP